MQLKQSIFKSKHITFILAGNVIAIILVILLLIYKYDTLNVGSVVGSIAILLFTNFSLFPLLNYCEILEGKIIIKNILLPSRNKEYFFNDLKMVILDYRNVIQIEFVENKDDNRTKYSLFLTHKKDLKTITDSLESKNVKVTYDGINKKHLV